MSERDGDNRDGLLTEDSTRTHMDRMMFDLDETLVPVQARRAGIASMETLKLYIFSPKGLELLFSTVLFGSALIGECVVLIPRQRAIPYQQLESTGEYVLNQMYNESFQGETISSGELFLYGAILPFVLQMLLSYFVGYHNNDDVHKTACVYGIAIGLTSLLTGSAKLYVGYLRPLFYTVCAPDDAYEYCSSGQDNGARKSFPSGHASISFCGLGLLSLYLESRFGVSGLRRWHLDSVSGQLVMTQKRAVRLERIKSILCYAPIVVAGFIATSRIVDNKHFPADVVGGSILGATVAKVVHGIWYE